MSRYSIDALHVPEYELQPVIRLYENGDLVDEFPNTDSVCDFVSDNIYHLEKSLDFYLDEAENFSRLARNARKDLDDLKNLLTTVQQYL